MFLGFLLFEMYMGDFFGAQKKLIAHVQNYFRDVSFSKPSPRSKSWENSAPRIGLRIGIISESAGIHQKKTPICCIF